MRQDVLRTQQIILNQFGLVVDWNVDITNVSDKTFHPLIEKFGPEAPPDRQILVLTDPRFHAKAKKG